MGGGRLGGGRLGGGVTFLFKKSSLLLLFLFIVEGLGFFLVQGGEVLCLLMSREASGFTVSRVVAFTLVSRLKVKEDPMLMEREIVWPRAASAWLKSRHLDTKSSFVISVGKASMVIFI